MHFPERQGASGGLRLVAQHCPLLLATGKEEAGWVQSRNPMGQGQVHKYQMVLRKQNHGSVDVSKDHSPLTAKISYYESVQSHFKKGWRQRFDLI